MIFKYKDKIYPDYLKEGDALKYILPIAQYFLKGKILDIGGIKDCHFPGAEYINIMNKDEFHAMNLPNKKYDGIISSHTLEHLKDPFFTLQYWTKYLKKNGVMFLYLPSESMEYWCFDNPRHLYSFSPTKIKGWLERIGYKNIIKSCQDMYFSFTVVGFKK